YPSKLSDSSAPAGALRGNRHAFSHPSRRGRVHCVQHLASDAVSAEICAFHSALQPYRRSALSKRSREPGRGRSGRTHPGCGTETLSPSCPETLPGAAYESRAAEKGTPAQTPLEE